jgi:hypothetical protein
LLRNAPPPEAELAEGGEKKKKSKRLPEHDFLENGLLRVNPRGQHPIYDLLAHGKQEWRRKVGKASKTLKQAVDEYRRRYGRAPPKGFDRWYVSRLQSSLMDRWEYAVKHNVQLPDEYDQIVSFGLIPRLMTSSTIWNLFTHSHPQLSGSSFRKLGIKTECTPFLVARASAHRQSTKRVLMRKVGAWQKREQRSSWVYYGMYRRIWRRLMQCFTATTYRGSLWDMNM